MRLNLHNLFKYFAIGVVSISIASNSLLCFSDSNTFCVISLRTIYLYLILFCFIKYNRWTFSILVLFNLMFWYNYFNQDEFRACNCNPIIDYTNGVIQLIAIKNHIFNASIGTLPLLFNVLISFYEIPYRLKKLNISFNWIRNYLVRK